MSPINFNSDLIIQLIISFLLGGFFIALLSYLAEYAPPGLSGLFLAFPSTVVLSYFFLGYFFSSETVSRIAPTSLMSLGASLLFPIIYCFTTNLISRHIHFRLAQISFSFIFSSIVWASIAFPITGIEISSIIPGILVYLASAVLVQLILMRSVKTTHSALKYSTGQLISRAVFVGIIIALVVLLSKLLNPFWGSIFAVYPALFASALVIFHWYYGSDYLFSLINNIPLGSISTALYIVIAHFLFPYSGYLLGTVIGLALCLLTSFILSRIKMPVPRHGTEDTYLR